jgi:hypothetical protein
MANSAKSTTKPAAKPAAKPRLAKTAATAEPFLRFYHSSELQDRTQTVLAALETATDQTDHADTLADLVAELTEAGMHYYYLRALKGAQAGFVVEQSARIAMSGAVKLISSVSRKFIVRVDNEQLLSVAQHIRELSR